MYPANSSYDSASPTSGRRPVFSPQFGQAYVTTAARPGDGTDDEANTNQTVQWMLEFARQDSASPIIRQATQQATQGSSGRQAAGRIFQWIRDHVKFQEDWITAHLAGLARPMDAEVLIRPVDLLSMKRPAGDCDDFTMLAIAMLNAAGIPAAPKAIEQDAQMPGMYSHIYAQAWIDGEWVPFDASHGRQMGWNAKPTGKSRQWENHTLQNNYPSSQIGAIDWGSLINKSLDITGKIVIPRFGLPDTPGGTVRLPDGTIATNSPIGTNVLFPGGAASSIGDSGNTGLLLLGGLAVVAIIAMKGSH